jgi:ligand-binding SRPBCC domain-containing protein
MPSIFKTSTHIPASAETLFAFHSDPNNISEVMPPTLKLVTLETDGPAKEGRIIKFHCRDWWILPIHWTCRWKTVQAPTLLVDEIVSGPFALFIHQHRFETKGPESCEMQDIVTYQWGRSWWGKLVSETGVRLYLKILFKYRHYRTRRWALKNQRTP